MFINKICHYLFMHRLLCNRDITDSYCGLSYETRVSQSSVPTMTNEFLIHKCQFGLYPDAR